MNRTLVPSAWLRAAATAALVASATLPAAAQYANEFVPAKLAKQGTTSKTIAGSGTVVVQVQVNADGSHKAIKVIKSTNPADNGAALDIAQNSTYHPARRGSTPITAFYDFTLKFNGKSVSNNQPSSQAGGSATQISPAAEKVAALIQAKQYSEAKSTAQSELASAPSDDSLRQMLGIAAYDDNDFMTAAAAFNQVPTVGKQFVPIAASSLAAAAVQSAQQNPSQAMQYAQKAMTLDPTTNSRFALGVAQLANNQNADALATLKAVHDAAISNTSMSTSTKVNIDSELLRAYMANNDTQGAQTVAAEIKQLDPSSTAAARVMGSNLVNAGVAAAKAKDSATALKDFDQAASMGDPDLSVVAYTQAAFTVAQESKPDYKQMQAYADKALALKPDDPQANFAEGISLTGQWASSHDDGTKTKALAALNKADASAKAAGNEALSLQIQSFIKQNLNASPAPQSGGSE
jgi:TonB family protein